MILVIKAQEVTVKGESTKCVITLNSVRQHNHFITQGNYKATCFDYRLIILRPILSIVSQDAVHTLGSHRVYVHGIHQIKSFVPKGLTCKLCLQQWDTSNWIICVVKCIIQIVSKKLKYVKYLAVYCCSPFANTSPVIVWLFLELRDTVYLLVTSAYVFVAVPWEWVCYQMISHAEVLISIVW